MSNDPVLREARLRPVTRIVQECNYASMGMWRDSLQRIPPSILSRYEGLGHANGTSPGSVVASGGFASLSKSCSDDTLLSVKGV